MPSGDRTGPVGQGPMTGRALGFCSGNNTPGSARGSGGGMGGGFGYGGGMGRGRGFGRGRNFGGPYAGFFQGPPWIQPVSKEHEIEMLKSQAEALKRSQREIEMRLGELEKKDN